MVTSTPPLEPNDKYGSLRPLGSPPTRNHDANALSCPAWVTSRRGDRQISISARDCGARDFFDQARAVGSKRQSRPSGADVSYRLAPQGAIELRQERIQAVADRIDRMAALLDHERRQVEGVHQPADMRAAPIASSSTREPWRRTYHPRTRCHSERLQRVTIVCSRAYSSSWSLPISDNDRGRSAIGCALVSSV